MTTLSSIDHTLGIVKSAGDLLKSNAVKTGAKAAIAARDISKIGGSLAQFAAQTSIIARIFYDETIAGEIVIPNFAKSCHEWYAAQVISALQISRLVDGKRTVQDYMSIVQDGHRDRQQDLVDNLLERAAGQESFLSNYLGDAGLESFSELTEELALEAYGPNRASDYIKTQREQIETLQAEKDELQRQRDHEMAKYSSSASLKSVPTSGNRMGPMGELFEVTLTHPSEKGASIKAPVFIQMQPSIIPGSIATRFIDMNVSPSVWQRWTQMRAGELTFWKDFIGQRDNINRLKAINKDPQAAAAFNDFQRTIAKKDKYALADVTTKSAARSANLANSVIVFSEDTVAQAKSESGIDLHNPRDRQRYFRDAYAMIIAIIDPLHQRVTVYFNGLDGELDCGYNDFKPKDSKFEPQDFMAALSAFSTNNVGRLR